MEWCGIKKFSFTWYRYLCPLSPPPITTVQAGGVIPDHLSSRTLHDGTIENLRWQFNLTELKFNYLVLSFDSTPFAEALALGKVAQSRFRNQFGIHWIRNKTLMTLMIANATNGTLTCQVNAFGVEGIGLPLQFENHVQLVVVGKFKLKSSDHYLFWVADFCNIYFMDKLSYSVVQSKNID